MKIIKSSLTLSLLLIINACTSTTLIPQLGDMQTVIANASTEDEAVKVANHKARRVCTLENQEINIIDLDTIYQGEDPDQKTLIKLAKRVLPEGKTPSSYQPENYNYKATLTFSCI